MKYKYRQAQKRLGNVDLIVGQIKCIHKELSTIELAGKRVSLKEQSRLRFVRCCNVLEQFHITEFFKKSEDYLYQQKMALKGNDDEHEQVTRSSSSSTSEFDRNKGQFNDQLSDEEYKQLIKEYKYARTVMRLAVNRRCKLWEKNVLDGADQRDRYLQYLSNLIKKYSKKNENA